MQEFDGPVGKARSSVKNQGKQEYSLCVVCKKKKKTVLEKGQKKIWEGKRGTAAFGVSLVQESYLAVSSERRYFT